MNFVTHFAKTIRSSVFFFFLVFISQTIILQTVEVIPLEEEIFSSDFLISLDVVMAAALENDASLSDARSKLEIAKNSLFKSNPLYASALVFNGSSKGVASEAEKKTGNDVQKSLIASLSVPFTRWLSLSAQGTTDLLQTTTLSLSMTLSLFSKPDTSAQIAWNKAMIEAQQAVRTTMLSVRKEYRSVLTARAEYSFREAAVRSAQNELSRVEYLVTLGQARPSELISVHSDLLDAQGYLDSATTNVSQALQALSARTLLDLNTDSAFEEVSIAVDRSLVNEEQWVANSADFALARINYESSKNANDVSISLPDVSFGAGITDTRAWNLSAKVSFSPDLIFQKTRASASASLAIQERALTASERAIRLAWKNQYNAYSMAEKNYTTASSFYKAAVLSYEESTLLYDRGDISLSSVDTVNEKLLSALYQKTKALESLENARDVLDIAWQLSL